MTAPVVGYLGMTHLGLTSAAAAAEKGVEVIGFDPDGALIERLRRGELPVVEPGLAESLADNRDHVAFTASAADLGACQLIYLAADVPTDDCGESDLAAIEALYDMADARAGPDSVLVILSQVPPGFTRSRARSGRRLHYQVETLVFGRALERARHPERFIVGCAEPGRALPEPLARFLDRFACPVLRMGYESAELAKISINCCLVASISVANTLAEICRKIGADWSEIVPALRLDRRIGPHAYLSPGLGLAGGNLERDLATVTALSQRHGAEAGVVAAWRRDSDHRRSWVLQTLRAEVLDRVADPLIAVLGLAYKENTSSTKNSPALFLIERLGTCRIALFDPVVAGDAAWHGRPAPSAMAAAKGADAVVLMTPWGEFAELAPKELAAVMRGRTVIDPYRLLDGRAVCEAGLDHITLAAPAKRAAVGT